MILNHFLRTLVNKILRQLHLLNTLFIITLYMHLELDPPQQEKAIGGFESLT